MKALLRWLLAGFVAVTAVTAHAQRFFAPGELEALLAPIALYPDPLLSQILDASQYPQEVQTAAAWTRANPQLSGDAALATVQGTLWAPSVKALVAYPDVLQRMADSPRWLNELGEAYAAYAPTVMATVQELRARAQASGYLQSDDQQYVYQQGGAIVVQPVYPNVVYAPYYDPYVVYGAWAWPVYRPVYWRPWYARPFFVTRVFIAPPVHWHDHPRAFVANPAPRIVQGGPVVVRPFRAVPESQRQPFIHSGGAPFFHGTPTPSAPVMRGAPAPTGSPFVRSAPVPTSSPFVRSAPAPAGSPFVRSAPAPRAHFSNGFAPTARAAVGGGRSSSGGRWGGGGHGGGHGGRH